MVQRRLSKQLRCALVAVAAGALLACGGGGSGGDAPPTSTTPTPVPPAQSIDEFRLEPAAGTTIGVGQQIDLFGAYRARRADPWPEYVDPQLIVFSSSQPGVAVVTSGGGVRGLSAGTTTLTATYRSISSQIRIVVAGSYEQRSVDVPGQGRRSYAIYVPAATSGPRPLLLAIHGGGGTARIHASMTLLARLGAEQGILIAWPEGTGAIQTFNAGSCCGGAQTQDVDDVAFLSAMIDDIEANHEIDPARVYASGFSNGGMMAYRLACQMADRIAGIAAVSGASGQYDRSGNGYYACAPTRPVRILHFHATNDRNYPYAGGFGEGLSNTDFFPVEATIADRRARNNLGPQTRIETPTATTTCIHHESPLDTARASAPVTLCRSDPPDLFDPVNGIVFGGGHSWPGGSRSPSPGGDVPLQDFDAGAYLWGLLNR